MENKKSAILQGIMRLDQRIEGLLFYKASPMKLGEIAKILESDVEKVEAGVQKLESRLQDGGTCIVRTDDVISLRTTPELDEFIDELRKDELKRDIGKAGAETLAIILYRGPLSRSEVDRIRGVNSSFVIRSLMMRGLVERTAKTEYQVTTDCLAHLGIKKKQELTNYQDVMDALDSYEEALQEESV